MKAYELRIRSTGEVLKRSTDYADILRYMSRGNYSTELYEITED